MRNAIALVSYGIAHGLLYVLAVAVGILELLWLIQLCLLHEYAAALVVFFIGTPIIYTVGGWLVTAISLPFMYVAIKLKPELAS